MVWDMDQIINYMSILYFPLRTYIA
jgi:hypothetical protein